MMGGIGFDQDPVVRTLAETNHMLYLYTMADDGSLGNGAPKPYKYSFTGAPTIEQVGTWMGQVAMKNDPGPYGAVYVNDVNWIGGYNTFKAYLNAHGDTTLNNNSHTMGAGGDTRSIQRLYHTAQISWGQNGVPVDERTRRGRVHPGRCKPSAVLPRLRDPRTISTL